MRTFQDYFYLARCKYNANKYVDRYFIMGRYVPIAKWGSLYVAYFLPASSQILDKLHQIGRYGRLEVHCLPSYGMLKR
jgi:hypothetical protein